jgi:NTP pyrophosphatase (non-canonical NTP hydrolase)
MKQTEKTMEDILKAVLAEVERAQGLHPDWPTDPLHALAVLGEEFGELTQSVLQATYEQEKSTSEHVRVEAIQTAAMALRFLLSLNEYDYLISAYHHQGE